MSVLGGYDPYEHAEKLGIKIVYRELDGCNAVWVSDLNAIFIKPGLRHIHERCVLTHELAHAELGHRCSSPKNELQADIYAALKLIDPHDLERAAAMYEHETFIAEEIGVTRPILHAYQLAAKGITNLSQNVGKSVGKCVGTPTLLSVIGSFLAFF